MARERNPLEAAAALFDLVQLPVTGVPVHFSVAVPGPGLAGQPGFPAAALTASGRVAAGRGRDPQQCRWSGLGEAAELVSATCWGNEVLVRARQNELGPAAICPRALLGLSPGQIRARSRWNARHGAFDWRPAPPARGRVLDWFEVADAFGGGRAWAPADFVFLGRHRPGASDAVAIADSSGCAAGADREQAMLAAALELIERDATGRWWYGRRRRPPLDPAGLERAGDLLALLARRRRRTWLFDISSDIPVPVVAAASAGPDGRAVALGIAARPELDAAAEAALMEMLQVEFSLALGADEGSHRDAWRRQVSMRCRPLDGVFSAPSKPLYPRLPDARGTTLSRVLGAYAAAGANLWFADLTRPVPGVPVFRALSTILCHGRPRFARPRLLAADGVDDDRPRRATTFPLLAI